MTGAVYTESFAAPPVNKREILRYALAGEDGDGARELMENCLREAERELSYRVCYAEFDVKKGEEGTDLGFAVARSSALEKNLGDSTEIVLFAATVGVGIDRLIARYSAVSPSRALMLQAIGTERVESLCDAFCARLAEKKRAEGRRTGVRFSPGYGDLPLSLQREVISALDCPKRIGVSLNESLIMSPSKSVTAIVGLHLL